MFKRPPSSPLPENLKQVLTPYFPDHDLSRVVIYEYIPWYIKRFARITPAAYTSGNKIHLAPGQYDPDSPGGIATIAHELTHTLQYRKYGKLRFRLKYLASYLRNKTKRMGNSEAYQGIPFEIEAYEKEQEVKQNLQDQPIN